MANWYCVIEGSCVFESFNHIYNETAAFRMFRAKTNSVETKCQVIENCLVWSLNYINPEILTVYI